MTITSLSKAFVAAGLLVLAPALAWAETAIDKDIFLSLHPLGTIGLVDGNFQDVSRARKIKLLDDDTAVTAPRQRYCRIAIGHFDPDRVGLRTFIGVQLILFHTRHPSPGAMHVGRNEGWASRRSGATMPMIQAVELPQTNPPDFASIHQNNLALSAPPLLLGRAKSVEWHAVAVPSDLNSYSATEEHARFWAVNPLESPLLRAVRIKEKLKADVVRTEHRLIQFELTDSAATAKIPNAQFDCNNPDLAFAAIRVYRPFSVEPEAWGFLSFE